MRIDIEIIAFQIGRRKGSEEKHAISLYSIDGKDIEKVGSIDKGFTPGKGRAQKKHGRICSQNNRACPVDSPERKQEYRTSPGYHHRKGAVDDRGRIPSEHGRQAGMKMEGIADCVLELQVLQKGSTFERFLSVKKMRNYAKKIGIARYAIDSDGFILEMIERIM